MISTLMSFFGLNNYPTGFLRAVSANAILEFCHFKLVCWNFQLFVASLDETKDAESSEYLKGFPLTSQPANLILS
jgi:hypothetical protein